MYVRLCDLYTQREKMVELFANSGHPDQSRVLRRFILVCIVCQLPVKGSPVYNGYRVTMGHVDSQK